MYMVGIAACNKRLAFEVFTNAAQVAVQFGFYRWKNEWFAVFGTKYEVDVIFDE